jgi:Holliday junction resolvase RusA-like endonuclease
MTITRKMTEKINRKSKYYLKKMTFSYSEKVINYLETSEKSLQISYRIAPGVFDIIFYIHPESKDKVKNNRRTKS